MGEDGGARGEWWRGDVLGGYELSANSNNVYFHKYASSAHIQLPVYFFESVCTNYLPLSHATKV